MASRNNRPSLTAADRKYLKLSEWDGVESVPARPAKLKRRAERAAQKKESR